MMELIKENRNRLIQQLTAYRAFNEQELVDQKRILEVLYHWPNVFLRENLTGHMTASAWVVNERRDRVLMAYHRIYDSWAWLGGHADGETDLLSVALREVREESGVSHVRALSEEPFSLEVLTVEGHEKRGVYVPSHLHFNVTYLLEAEESDPLRNKADENSAVSWFSLSGAVEASREPWFQERIYKKLNAKLPEK